jgi:two-component system response regulator HydG
MATILLIDDDEAIRRALEAGLRTEGHEVHTAVDFTSALQTFKEESFDLVLTDVRLPDSDGLTLLRELKTLHPEVAAIVFSGEGTIETAVSAMRLGAVDYLQKPLRMREVLRAVSRALDNRRLTLENRQLKEEQASRRGAIIGSAGGLAAVMDLVGRVGPIKSPVLLIGESGAGKELIANSIHAKSVRNEKPFIKVNCGAIPQELIEAEFFGHEKGAFTGAVAAREGRFEAADGGSLFLDELGEMPLQTQVKLLRVLQEGTFERVGSTKTRKVDVRIIAATNRDLKAAIKAGTFREDLFFRLNVIEIVIPPLRSRHQDLPALIDFFIEKYAREFGRIVRGLNPEALDVVYHYAWPGNVRELENAIARGVALAQGDLVSLQDLPLSVAGTELARNRLPKEVAQVQDPDGRALLVAPLGISLAELEQIAIEKTLAFIGGNREKAAAMLGISHATLYRKLKEYRGLPQSSPTPTEG